MENKINIAELLKDCPSGMELDCAIYDDVKFNYIDEDTDYPIRCFIENENSPISFNKYGEFNIHNKAKCVIFPKGKTTWEGFQRPFTDGDIIFTHIDVGVGNTWISIFQENRNGGVATYVDYAENGSDYYDYIDSDKYLLCMNKDILLQRFATEEEKQKLFDAIKADGYYWNAETKTLEVLIEPEFKVGDRIRHKEETTWGCTIARVEDRYYVDGHPTCYTLPFEKQNEYELIPNKFDISTLKPFDKVLIRDNNRQEWAISLFSHCNGTEKYKYYCMNGRYAQCIPYKGNEYLLGTTNDCDEYYKTWK